MDFPNHFIRAGADFTTLEHSVPAPLFRRRFNFPAKVTAAELLICGLGFYDLFLNGQRITKGALAPYISAPDDLYYYDHYEVSANLQEGVNVIGVILGNGMQNPFGGFPWGFEKAHWRGAPQLALRLEATLADGSKVEIDSGEGFLTIASPIIRDDLRLGEQYDARLEQPGWNTADFDDSGWQPALPAPRPAGRPFLCKVESIANIREIPPVSVTPVDGGYIFDFGINEAGICRLSLCGKAGQLVKLQFGEVLVNGRLSLRTTHWGDESYHQEDVYICRGDGLEGFTPRFTYHGFRYVFVQGVTQEQAAPSLLTCIVQHSDLAERGGFSCSNSVANTLQEITRRSTLSNFFYFPTDCPHREKNGWTGDAALSAEHTLLNLAPERSYREWLRNVRAAQNEAGSLPGIVPTAGWGFEWGNGPAWDAVLIYLPYYTWLFRGDTEIVSENTSAIFRYLHYLVTRLNGQDLLAIGLGDWATPGRNADSYVPPLALTDSVTAMDICRKAAVLFRALKMPAQAVFADTLRTRLRTAVRAQLIDANTLTAAGNCQTSQAMCLHYGVFDSGEEQEAFNRLLELIDQAQGHMTTGILGARVLFHVLSDHGQSDLAWEIIIRSDHPSYGNWVARGATTLWEEFQPEDKEVYYSLNHHFFGDISGWFIRCVAGIRVNPNETNTNEVCIQPAFIHSLDWAEAFHDTPAGRVHVRWEHKNSAYRLFVEAPEELHVDIHLPAIFSTVDVQFCKSPRAIL